MIVSTAGSGLAVQSSVGALGSVAAVAAVFPRSYCGSGHWSYAGIHIATIADTDLCRDAVRATKHPKTNEKVATREVGVYGTVVRISVYRFRLQRASFHRKLVERHVDSRTHARNINILIEIIRERQRYSTNTGWSGAESLVISRFGCTTEERADLTGLET